MNFLIDCWKFSSVLFCVNLKLCPYWNLSGTGPENPVQVHKRSFCPYSWPSNFENLCPFQHKKWLKYVCKKWITFFVCGLNVERSISQLVVSINYHLTCSAKKVKILKRCNLWKWERRTSLASFYFILINSLPYLPKKQNCKVRLRLWYVFCIRNRRSFSI